VARRRAQYGQHLIRIWLHDRLPSYATRPSFTTRLESRREAQGCETQARLPGMRPVQTAQDRMSIRRYGKCSEVHISMLTLCRRRRQSECSTVQSMPSRREGMYLRTNKKEENLVYWLVSSGRSTTLEQFRLTRCFSVISIPSQHWPESILDKPQPSSRLHWPGSISNFTPDLTSL
jgi:hypothetical protein